MMPSTVHLHLLLNHLPIIITAIALIVLAIAVWRNDDYLVRIALAFFVVSALSTLPTYLTGEGAEHAVRNMPDVTRDLIEAHSDMALFAAVAVGILGVCAAWTLWRFRSAAVIPATAARLMLIGGIIGAGLMAYTGLLGGQIRHTEVRPGFVPPARSTQR